MPDKRDYYQVLEVPRDASSEDLRRAYRRLAKQYHPDVNKETEAEERFKEINEAYAVLSDDERRAAYDRFGHAGVQGMPADFGLNPFDIFEEFFGFGMGGGRRSRRSPHRGADLRYDLSLAFEESVFGVEKEIAFARQDTCPTCAGSGAEPGTTPVRCKTCNGAGEVRQVRQTFLGSMVNVSTCPTCGGAGETVATPCRGCRGSGQQRAEVKRLVPIPAGVDDGTQIRLSSEGEPGINGGPRGDLYLVLHVKPHRFFRRREDDILLDVSINIAQAALGAKISVPTVDGDEALTVPAGTQAGRVLRLKGKGVPHVRRTGRGDQLVMLSVEVPRTLSKDQRELFEKLGATLGSEARPQEKSFLDSLKDLFGGIGRVKWLEVRLTVDGERAEAVADLLARHATGGVAIESAREGDEAALPGTPVIVRAYLPADEMLETRRTSVEHGLWHLGMIHSLPAPAYRAVAEEDWAEAWKEHYHPIRIGRRLLILPAWLPSPDDDRLAIVLDPGMAFGTGTHPSTQLCLAALEDYLRPGDEVIDLGCGSGILSIAAARLGARRVRALDIDPLAVRIARENAERNGLAAQIDVSTGSLPELLEPRAPSADLMVANILAPVLDEMARHGLARAVRPGGVLILAGVLAEQAEALEATCVDHGLERLEQRQSGEWRALVLKSKPPYEL